jgi:hypothetical protein
MIHIARNGALFGKYDKSEIASLVRNQVILPGDDYWMNGMSKWGKVSDLLRQLAQEASTPPPVNPPSLPPKNNLINCPDCNREVSKFAPTCLGCGRLLNETPNPVYQATPLRPPQPVQGSIINKPSQIGKTIWLVVAFFAPLIGFWRIILDKSYGYSKTTKVIFTGWFSIHCLVIFLAVFLQPTVDYGYPRANSSPVYINRLTGQAKKYYDIIESARYSNDKFTLRDVSAYYVYKGVNKLMPYTDTRVFASEGVLIVYSNTDLDEVVGGMPSIKTWAFTIATVTGYYFNELNPNRDVNKLTNPHGVREVWMTDKQNFGKQFYVLKVSDGQAMQRKCQISQVDAIDAINTIWGSLEIAR